MGTGNTLYTLGRLELGHASVQRLPLLLLTWLVMEGPTARRRLRELFWPGAAGNAQLRVTLTKLRAALPGLTFTGDVLSAALPCDALHLLASPQPHRAYPGAFLAHVHTEHLSAEFQEWVLEQRERLAETVQLGLLREAERCVSPGGAHALAEQAAQVAGAPPFAPEVIARLQVLALPGTVLAASLRRERASLGPAEPMEQPALPLVGRDRELAQVLSHVTGTGPNALHVTGPGGVGKTSLLLAAVREAQALGHRAVYLAVDAHRSLAAVAAQLTRALGLPPTLTPHPFEQLGQDLRAQSLLVVLDGTDHLSDLPAALTGLLHGAPSVRVLTAGRAALPGAWPHLTLAGLTTPSPEDPAPALRFAPAVQVLLRAAGPGAPTSPHDLQALGVIARQVQGLPLALRLVGHWMRQRPLPEVLQLLVQGQAAGLDGASPLPPILRRSWYDCPGEAQQALLRLAQAPDWHREDLAAITAISPELVQALVASGLLLHQGERVQVLPLLTAWLRTQQVFDPALAGRHADLHLQRLMTADPLDPRLVAEQANVLQAVHWRAREGQLGEAVIARLTQQFERLGLCSTGEAALAEVDVPRGGAVWATLHVHRAWLAFRAGRTRDAEGLVRAVLALDSPDGRAGHRARMQAHNVLAVLQGHRGESEQATASLRQAAALADQLGDGERAGVYLSNLALQQKNLGRYAEALATLQSAHERHGRQDHELNWGNELRALQVQLDDPDADPGLLLTQAEGLAHRVQAAAPQLRGLARLAAAQAALQLQQSEQALRHTAQVRSLLTRTPDQTLQAATELTSARAHYQQYNTPAAREALRRAVSLCLHLKDDAGLLDTLVVMAEDLADTAPHLARRLASAVVTHRCSSAAQRRKATPFAALPLGGGPPQPLEHWIRVGLDALGLTPPTESDWARHGPP